MITDTINAQMVNDIIKGSTAAKIGEYENDFGTKCSVLITGVLVFLMKSDHEPFFNKLWELKQKYDVLTLY